MTVEDNAAEANRSIEEQLILRSIHNFPESPTAEDFTKVRTLAIAEIAELKRQKYQSYIDQWPDDPRCSQWREDINSVTKWEIENS